MNEFEAVIGLEAHAQLKTASKMFCPCPQADPGAEPNSHICPVCTGQPGTLPSLNKKAVELGIKAGIALNCRVNEISVFARKNYFYPDLPKAYQISQFDRPLCAEGGVEIDLKPSGTRTIRVARAHLEEDAGKSLHALGSRALDHTLLDFNRCGVPLIEIVSEPDIRSADEAHACLAELKKLLQWADISECDMEKGELRCDVNISMSHAGTKEPGSKVEIKNLNSFKAVKDAINHETERQTALLKRGGTVERDTRLWNEKERKTVSMRSKELAHDYRYFPEPDLPPLCITAAQLEAAKAEAGEPPRARKARFARDFALNGRDAETLTSNRHLSGYFEACMKAAAAEKAEAKTVANLITGEFFARANELKITPENYLLKAISPLNLVKLAALSDAGRVSATAAKAVFAASWETGKDPAILLVELGLERVDNAARIEAWAREAIAANPGAAEDFKNGNDRALGPIVGMIISKSGGKANPRLAGEIIKKLLLQ